MWTAAHEEIELRPSARGAAISSTYSNFLIFPLNWCLFRRTSQKKNGFNIIFESLRVFFGGECWLIAIPQIMISLRFAIVCYVPTTLIRQTQLRVRAKLFLINLTGRRPKNSQIVDKTSTNEVGWKFYAFNVIRKIKQFFAFGAHSEWWFKIPTKTENCVPVHFFTNFYVTARKNFSDF